MALSYGLTNPAAFKKGGGSEPTPIGYKLYMIAISNRVCESNDFGLTWNECTWNTSTASDKYNLGYDPINNKIIILSNYSPYKPSSVNFYCWTATPVLNQNTQFNRVNVVRTRSPAGNYGSNRYNQYGALFDYKNEILISTMGDEVYTPKSYDFMLTPDYNAPNTTKTVGYFKSYAVNPFICTGDNGINFIMYAYYRSSSSDEIEPYEGRVFEFNKTSSSYTVNTLANISASDLGNKTNYTQAGVCYLKNIGFVVYFKDTKSPYNITTRLFDFNGVLKGSHNWGNFNSSTGKTALSTHNYYSNRVYFVIDNKVYYTTDGLNWNSCTDLPSSIPYTGLPICNTRDKIVIQKDTSNYSNYVSTDGGITWQTVTTSFSAQSLMQQEVSYRFSDRQMILVPIYA